MRESFQLPNNQRANCALTLNPPCCNRHVSDGDGGDAPRAGRAQVLARGERQDQLHRAAPPTRR